MHDLLPLVTVVTPSYNQSQFLEGTILSVLDQDYPKIEYIICDAGSTDGSREIIQKYSDRLAFWVSEKDHGQADAINKGLSRANGQILAYINSDDTYEPRAVRRVVEYFRQHPEICLVYGNFARIDEDSHPIAIVEAPEYDFALLLRRDIICQPTLFWRAEVTEKIGIFDEQLHYVMDYEYCLRAALEGFQFSKISGPPLACFREWGGAKTSLKAELGLQEEWAMLSRHFSDPRLPEVYKKLKNEALAYASLWIGSLQYQIGAMSVSRRYLWKAFITCPPLITKSQLLPIYAKTFLGARLSSRAREILKNLRK